MVNFPRNSREGRELREALDAAYWEGFAFGRDAARIELRDQIEHELETELARFDPDCPMCKLTRELDELREKIRCAEIDRDDAQKKLRGVVIREGVRGYRETR